MPLSPPTITSKASSNHPTIGIKSGTKSIGDTVYIKAKIKGIHGLIPRDAG